jgi:hypothetical protein
LHQLAAAETVVPSTLGPLAKQRLEDELYDLQRRIFRGVDKAAFVAYVIDSKAEHNWIQLYRDRDGALGGYATMHVYEREIDGRAVAVVRCETGTLREHRGANLIGAFYAERLLRMKLAHPRRPLYFLGTLVHPSSYAMIARNLGEALWPREGAEAPEEIRALMESLGDVFGLPRVDPENTLVRKVGWQTIDSAADRAYWERCERPGVQFFLRANPGYEEGNGLLTLVPLTHGVFARGLVRYAHARGTRGVRRLAARARASVAALLPAPTAATAR